MFRRIYVVIVKEMRQILRDPISLILLFILPAFLIFIFGYAINLDIRKIPMAVLDNDHTENSRTLIDRFVTSGYFVLQKRLFSEHEINRLLDRGEVKVVIKIPANFQRDIYKGKSTPVQILIDGTDNNTATVVMGYAKTIMQEHSRDVLFEILRNSGSGIQLTAVPTIDVRPNIWYNPELRSVNFLVPGLIAIIMMVVGVVAMSVSIVREKERGTIEALMVSPLRPAELMVGKIVPYIVIAFVDLLSILLLGRYFFDVPFRGDFALFLLLSLIFLASALAMGLYISSIAKTCQVAWLISFLATILPSIILSGFIFPIRNMPQIIQVVTYILPVRYFIIIVRGIILKGVGLSTLYPQTLALLGFVIGLLILCSFRFKKRIE
jgi:ABC-2 type transport system permease protein